MAMTFLLRLLLALCVVAGMANGMVHKCDHDTRDGCAEHSHDSGNSQDTHDDGEGKNSPHQHRCCHVPSADFPSGRTFLAVIVQPILVAIGTDATLLPDEPVFALDKPPLI